MIVVYVARQYDIRTMIAVLTVDTDMPWYYGGNEKELAVETPLDKRVTKKLLKRLHAYEVAGILDAYKID